MIREPLAGADRLPLLLEFTGLPGAGKTTIARSVFSELARVGYRCVTPGSLGAPRAAGAERWKATFGRLRNLWGLISVSVLNPGVSFHAAAYGWGAAPRSLVTVQRLKTLLESLRVIREAMGADCDLVILEQGLIQNVWSITAVGEPPKDDRGLRALLESVLQGLSPLIVVVDIDVERAVTRIGGRTTMDSRFDRMSAARAAALLGRHREILDRIVRCAAELPTIQSLRVDGGRPVEENVSLLVDHVRNVRR